MTAGFTNASELLSPASGHIQKLAEHELCDMGGAARAAANPLSKRGPKKKNISTPRGVCGYADCPTHSKEATHLPKRDRFFCAACRDGKGSYYHLQCFFKCHRCLQA